MSYIDVSERPTLRKPILIGAFAGWSDAAETATSAIKFLVQNWSAAKFASVDPEEFYVFTEVRPQVRLVGSTSRQINWPANDFYYHIDPSGGHDYILLLGIEPQLKWKAFCRTVLEFAQQNEVSTFVTLGGLLADVAHTMPTRLTGSASTPEMLERLKGLVATGGSRYQGPTGILGVLNTQCREQSIATASIWGNAPHYLTGIANPRVTRDVLRALGTMLNLELDLSGFGPSIIDFESQVNAAISNNPDVVAYVRRLEQRDRENLGTRDEEATAAPENPPTTENLLKELEEFLRHRRQEDEKDQNE